MGPEAGDEEQSSTLKLPLLSIPATMCMHSPERPGMLTSPLHTSAAKVPFRWEVEPGKPKPCNTLITLPNSSSKSDFSHKCLDLPPRLLLMDATASNANNITKLSSSTTVLEGPYVSKSSRFQTPSFRMSTSKRYGSFRMSLSPEKDHSKSLQKDKGVFGSWRKKGLKSNKKEVGGCSYVFPSSVDNYSEFYREEDGSTSNCTSSSTSDKITRITRSGSFTNVSLARPRFWATIYGGLKQVVPWRKKKEGLLT